MILFSFFFLPKDKLPFYSIFVLTIIQVAITESLFFMFQKIQKMLIFPEELQKNETIENAINKHFLHLHGVLQNIEKRSIDRLYEQRDSLTKNLEILQQRLNVQESQLQSVLTVSIPVELITHRKNLRNNEHQKIELYVNHLNFSRSKFEEFPLRKEKTNYKYFSWKFVSFEIWRIHADLFFHRWL